MCANLHADTHVRIHVRAHIHVQDRVPETRSLPVLVLTPRARCRRPMLGDDAPYVCSVLEARLASRFTSAGKRA